jgi:hypothetical protein
MERFFRIQEQQRRLFNDLRDSGLGWRVTSPHGTASSAEEDARSQLSYQTHSLGARGHLPCGYMVGSWWVLSKFAWQIPSE